MSRAPVGARYLRIVPSRKDTGEIRFLSPLDIDIDATGLMYILDNERHEVAVLATDSTASAASAWTSWSPRRPSTCPMTGAIVLSLMPATTWCTTMSARTDTGGLTDPAVLGRLLTRLGKRSGEQCRDTRRAAVPPQPSHRVGITGSPGVGKSTLIRGLIRRYRRLEHRVGVVAVDPTSPLSGGAILGDRIRLGDTQGDTGVFIRSLGSRGSLGGVTPRGQRPWRRYWKPRATTAS